jgi:hypothetical protein
LRQVIGLVVCWSSSQGPRHIYIVKESGVQHSGGLHGGKTVGWGLRGCRCLSGYFVLRQGFSPQVGGLCTDKHPVVFLSLILLLHNSPSLIAVWGLDRLFVWTVACVGAAVCQAMWCHRVPAHRRVDCAMVCVCGGGAVCQTIFKTRCCIWFVWGREGSMGLQVCAQCARLVGGCCKWLVQQIANTA